ncbi:acyl-CoA dehydrogenase [Actinoplanes sp. OR16]|uniref:acyl-CoA dehydrogenase family protein n=1 Tax=Actinoplanes sp. OR16 TaxID=946334 RepID=UPI000F6F3A68|nr:acyl-CoA dehydrogenase family protein [Actinoplanes sp. OR16]BBH67440.1 acyl-CoA dehydrogenase [Actinoplanes sp. OR16]
MSHERELLRSAVRGLLSGVSALDGFSPALWQRLCKEIGVAGLAVPESHGGAGATILESLVVLEELGRTLTPAPMLNTLLATSALLESGNADVCARLLPAICAGDLIPAVTWDGTVIDASHADLILTVTDGDLRALDPASVVHDPLPSLDLTREMSVTGISDSPDGELLGSVSADRLWDLACVALSAEQVGAAGRALELTVEYSKNRVQFGRAIGGFQVLQHRMAEAHVLVEAARSACWTAADAFVAGSPDAGRLAAVSKIWCSETLQTVAAGMTQIHGGLAITWEHDAHLYLRRAWDTAQLFGSPRSHLERLADALLAGD